MNLPTLALVTSMCKGYTLYTHLHLRKDKFSMNKTVIIAQQISQVIYRRCHLFHLESVFANIYELSLGNANSFLKDQDSLIIYYINTY